MIKSILISILILFSTSLYAQTINGVITDSLNVAIPYTSIGVKGTSIGTVSNEKGIFVLDLSKVKDNPQIVVSNISYKLKEYSLKEFKELINAGKAIILEENSQKLREVTVSSKKLKERNLGNKTTSRLFQSGFYGNTLGYEIGGKIEIKNTPTYIDSFNFFIASCDCDSLFFRLNIYSITDDMPYENLLPENIYFSTDITSGKVSIDLTKYNIQIEQDVIITIEKIKHIGKGGGIMFSQSLLGNDTYLRGSVVSQWKVDKMSIGFNVNVRY